MNSYDPLDMTDLSLLNQASRKDENAAQDSIYLKMPDKPVWSLRLRLLPGKPGKRPYATYGAHKLAGKIYICRRVPQPTPSKLLWVAPTEGGDCPVCAYWKAKWARIPRGQQPDEALKVLLSEIKQMVRVSWNVIVRKLDDKTNVGPLIWSCGITTAQKIWASILGDVQNGIQGKGDIFHPTTGRDFLLKKKPKGGSTFPDYSDSEVLEPTPAGTSEEWENWIANLHDLAPEPASYEQLRHALCVHLGSEEDTEGGFDTAAFEKPMEHLKEAGAVAAQVKKEVQPQAEEDSLVDPEFMRDLEAVKAEMVAK
jgi:hypothetical protein